MNMDFTKFSFYKHLTDSEKELFEKSVSFQLVEKGTKFRTSESNPFGLFLIIEGRIRVYLHNNKSREIFLYSLGVGDLCILMESKSLSSILFEAELTAETNLLVYCLESSAFKTIIENNSLVKSLIYETIIERLSIFVDSIQDILFSPIKDRLSRFILEEYYRIGSLTINRKQDEIAKNISSSKEVVCRILKELANDGAVSYERGIIRILDLEKIKKSAC